MLVQDILKSDRHSVVSVEANMAVSEAARIMANNRIGFTTVVDEDGALVGVLSERDLLAALSEGTEMAGRTSVDSIMTKTLIACHMADSVLHAIELMGSNNIRHLVVLENGEIAGVLSSRDLFDIMAKRIDERGLINITNDASDDEGETDEALSA
jgi:CBS domain-containing protein